MTLQLITRVLQPSINQSIEWSFEILANNLTFLHISLDDLVNSRHVNKPKYSHLYLENGIVQFTLTLLNLLPRSWL